LIYKCLFPAAGYGTRFLPATKAVPKEMLPILTKPLLQYGAEEALSSGILNMAIITGRGKRSIEDHFDSSVELESQLSGTGKEHYLTDIKNIIENPVWNEEAINFWNEFTFVDTKQLLKYKTDKINLCYSKIRIDYCYKELYKFIYKHIIELKKNIVSNNLSKLRKYKSSNINYDDKFYIEELSPENLLSKLNELYLELGERIKLYEK